ncbi:hypothetical protein PSP6_60122 [Paraburkholderia tropica]|nr:hypothetical protein PSP6_60122 [Paraburkholderia tropica]
MKKDHPWSRGREIVPPRIADVGHIIWNNTFHKSAEYRSKYFVIFCNARLTGPPGTS